VFTAGNPPAPQGAQVAFLQGQGSVSQSVYLAAGTYVITFDAAQRGNYNHGGQSIRVLVDGGAVGTVTPVGTAYAQYSSLSFTVTAGMHAIALAGLNPTGGDNSALVDLVAIENLY
jgi:hypothetical protein